MDHFKVQSILDTFQIICDTREQETTKAAERYKSFGVPYQRATLNYGDYCANITIDGKALYSLDETIKASCVVERKMSLDELAMCFCRGRDRFEREFQKAADNGSKIYLLVENATWEALMNHRYRSKFTPKAFIASLVAWMIRYNMTPIMCKSDTSGALIKEILYRDMKERLERGDFDVGNKL